MLDAQRELRGDVLLEDGASRLNCQAGDAYAHSRAYEAGSQEPGPSAGPGSPHSGLIHGFPKGIGATRPDDEFDDDNEEDCVQFKVGAIYQLIEGKRLCFVVHRDDEETLRDIRRFPKLFFFSSDLQERYQSFCADFGPVNLGIVHRFCQFVHAKYTDPRLKRRTMVYYTDENPSIRTNTIFLLGCYMILHHNLTAEEAWRPFSLIKPSPWLGFRDATHCDPTYLIFADDCFEGLQRATSLGWYDMKTFNLEEYEYWEHPLNGDLHQINPKFIAFKGPSGEREEIAPGVFTFQPEDYIDIFRERGVTSIVRLNEADTYDKTVFTKAGFNFYDMYFDDCMVPPSELVRDFLDMCDADLGVVAVHCRAGLGRTGTLIALHMMKNNGFLSNEAIAWLRIVRSGSVIGPQQQYLEACDYATWRGNLPIFPPELACIFEGNADVSALLSRQVTEGMTLRGVERVQMEMDQGQP